MPSITELARAVWRQCYTKNEEYKWGNELPRLEAQLITWAIIIGLPIYFIVQVGESNELDE